MARTIVLAAPAKQLSNVVGHPHRRRIYHRGQPVWEDQDYQRDEASPPGLNQAPPKKEPSA
jgi:hypothetical protein